MGRGTAREAVGSVYASSAGSTSSWAWCRTCVTASGQEANIVPPSTTSSAATRHRARDVAWRRTVAPAARALFAGSVLLAAPGCIVTTYQPIAGLNHPVVVDPTRPNLRDTHLDVVCLPGEGFPATDANALCNRLRTLFENQGARVSTGLDRADADRSDDDTPRPVHLTVEIASRDVRKAYHPLTWAFTAASFTLFPGVSERTFEQEVTIRDATGFLLVRDTLRGRLVHRFGAGIWLATAVSDLFRPPGEKLGRGAAGRDLSDDVYRQLSQLAFDARVHAQVLRVASPRPGPAAPRDLLPGPAALPGIAEPAAPIPLAPAPAEPVPLTAEPAPPMPAEAPERP